MSKSKSNKILLIVFVVLLSAVVVTQVIKTSKGERSFKSELTNFAVEDVVSVDIFSKASNFEKLSILNDNDSWRVEFSSKTYPADNGMISNMLSGASNLLTDRLVATDKDLWPDYDVNDTSAVHVIVNGANKALADFFIGRFSYNQATRKPSTYVRLNKEKEVYSVEGYLSMTFNRDLNGLRNKSIFQGNSNDLTKLTFTMPADSSFMLEKQESSWLINGVPADSAETAKFLGSITYLIGQSFRDDVTVQNFGNPEFQLIIEGLNMSSVEIQGIIEDDGRKVIHSSFNSESYFDGDAGDLFAKIFKSAKPLRSE